MTSARAIWPGPEDGTRDLRVLLSGAGAGPCWGRRREHRRQTERERVQDDSAAKAPATELGLRAKREMGMPTTLVDRIVSDAATQRLRSFKPRLTRSASSHASRGGRASRV